MSHGYLLLTPETKLFGRGHDHHQRRYRCLADARQGHAEALEMVRGEGKT